MIVPQLNRISNTRMLISELNIDEYILSSSISVQYNTNYYNSIPKNEIVLTISDNSLSLVKLLNSLNSSKRITNIKLSNGTKMTSLTNVFISEMNCYSDTNNVEITLTCDFFTYDIDEILLKVLERKYKILKIREKIKEVD